MNNLKVKVLIALLVTLLVSICMFATLFFTGFFSKPTIQKNKLAEVTNETVVIKQKPISEFDLEKIFSINVAKIGNIQVSNMLAEFKLPGKKISSFTRDEEAEWLNLKNMIPELESQEMYKWPCIYKGEKTTVSRKISCYSKNEVFTGTRQSGLVLYEINVVTPASFDTLVYNGDKILISGRVSSIKFSKIDLKELEYQLRNRDNIFVMPNTVIIENGNVVLPSK